MILQNTTSTPVIATHHVAGYASNGRETNHHLISFLQRIAHPEHGLNLEPMLYQVPPCDISYVRYAMCLVLHAQTPLPRGLAQS